jgi:hypothetical protein
MLTLREPVLTDRSGAISNRKPRCLVEVWNCVHVDISLSARMASARFGNARAIIRRARAGATSMVGKDYLPAIAPKCPSGRAMGDFKMAR